LKEKCDREKLKSLNILKLAKIKAWMSKRQSHAR
jgi:hypothetical protein